MGMNRTLIGLAVVAVALGATVARADWDDDFEHGARAIEPNHVHRGCHRPVAPPPQYTQQQGRYELQNVQRWVPGTSQQVWVPGECRMHRRWQRCSPGYYRTVWTQGHYETTQEWVWVAYGTSYQYQQQQQYQPQYQQQYQYGSTWQGGAQIQVTPSSATFDFSL